MNRKIVFTQGRQTQHYESKPLTKTIALRFMHFCPAAPKPTAKHHIIWPKINV